MVSESGVLAGISLIERTLVLDGLVAGHVPDVGGEVFSGGLHGV